MEIKVLCQTHRFMYRGSECPLCRQERIDRYSHRFVRNSEEKPRKEPEREITEDDLAKLMGKFNRK